MFRLLQILSILDTFFLPNTHCLMLPVYIFIKPKFPVTLLGHCIIFKLSFLDLKKLHCPPKCTPQYFTTHTPCLRLIISFPIRTRVSFCLYTFPLAMFSIWYVPPFFSKSYPYSKPQLKFEILLHMNLGKF